MRKITLRVLAILLVNLNFLFGDITGNVFRDFPIEEGTPFFLSKPLMGKFKTKE